MPDIMLKNVVQRFSDLWTPVEFKAGDGKPRWNITVLVEPGSENDKNIQEAILAAAKETFNDKAESVLKGMRGQKNQYCYLSGDSVTYDGCEGKMLLAAHRPLNTKSGKNHAPLILAKSPRKPDGTPNLLLESDGAPYNGCVVNVKVSIWAQPGENPGIRASFSAVQLVSDGEAFGASAVSVNEFDDLSADDLV